MANRFDFASIGAYTRDTIVSAAGTRYVNGGGYSYAAHAALLSGLKVAAVTRLAREDLASTDLLRSSGVEVIVHESPTSTLMRLEYPTANVDERILSVAVVAEPFGVEHVRDLDARAMLITASIRGEVPLAVVQELRKRDALLALDVQGFVRIVGPGGRLQYQQWPEMRAVLALVDILKTAFRQGAIAPLRHHHAITLDGRPEATLLLMPAWEAKAPGSETAGRYLGVS